MISSQQSVVPHKGYELLVESRGRKTISCKVRLPSVGTSKELSTITAAKAWVAKRDSLPMERREPFEALSTGPSIGRTLANAGVQG